MRAQSCDDVVTPEFQKALAAGCTFARTWYVRPHDNRLLLEMELRFPVRPGRTIPGEPGAVAWLWRQEDLPLTHSAVVEAVRKMAEAALDELKERARAWARIERHDRRECRG